jgi:hypothetical protein
MNDLLISTIIFHTLSSVILIAFGSFSAMRAVQTDQAAV